LQGGEKRVLGDGCANFSGCLLCTYHNSGTAGEGTGSGANAAGRAAGLEEPHSGWLLADLPKARGEVRITVQFSPVWPDGGAAGRVAVKPLSKWQAGAQWR